MPNEYCFKNSYHQASTCIKAKLEREIITKMIKILFIILEDLFIF